MKSSTFVVTTGDIPITTTIATRSVLIQESPAVASWPTTDYKLKFPNAGNTAIQRSAGTSFEINPGYIIPAGKIIGYVSAVTGTTIFTMYEEGL